MAIFASFARYIFRTITFQATFIILYYEAPYWLFIDTERDDLEWPEWSFWVKIWFGLGIQWVGVLAVWRKLFGNLHSYAYTVSGNKQESSAKLTNQRVSYAFTSSPFIFHSRHILPTSKFQHSYSCILLIFYRPVNSMCETVSVSVNTVHWFDASSSGNANE